MRRCFSQFVGLLIIAIVLSACNLPAAKTPPPAIQATTNPVSVIESTATQPRPAEVAATDTPTITPTETLTPQPSATVTPQPPTAKVVRESNCRVGPGGLYTLVATYQVGQMLEVVARDLGSSYLFVKNLEKPDEQCYLLAQNVTISGEITALPRYTPPSSPTAAPYFNLTFKKFDACQGEEFALFIVENVGSIPFRSAYIKVINQKTGKSVEQALNAFDLRVKCVLAKNIAPLDPGATGYVASPPFKWSGHADKLRAVIMLCTEKSLKGTCVTQTVDIKE